MANEGHIFVKGKGKTNVRNFFMPVDKGSNKPAFCYPKRIDALREEVKTMRKNLENNNLTGDRVVSYRQKVEAREKRLAEIEASRTNADELVKTSGKELEERRAYLAEFISENTYTREDEAKGRVNPFRNLKKEKEEGLEAAKKEYIIISRALGEESNVSFLQKDK